MKKTLWSVCILVVLVAGESGAADSLDVLEPTDIVDLSAPRFSEITVERCRSMRKRERIVNGMLLGGLGTCVVFAGFLIAVKVPGPVFYG